MRIAIVFDVDAETGYRIGEYLDSDIQPVLLIYRNRDGDNVALVSGEWSAEDVLAALDAEAAR